MIAAYARRQIHPPLGLAPLLAIAIGLLVAGHFVSNLIQNPGRFDWQIGLYKYSLFLFSYQDLGFVKRGLVGSLLDLENDVESRQWVTFLSFGVAVILAIMLCNLIKRENEGTLFIYV